MVERADLLVVGTGCSICHAVMCDQLSVIGADHPFIIDVRLLKMARDGEWDSIRLLFEDALKQWSEMAQQYRDLNPQVTNLDVLPFLVTTEGSFIAKGVYDRMEMMKREVGR